MRGRKGVRMHGAVAARERRRGAERHVFQRVHVELAVILGAGTLLVNLLLELDDDLRQPLRYDSGEGHSHEQLCAVMSSHEQS